ncbi:MAG: glycoside hydrolase family 3 N-terminal domain-containing protein [Christensenellales bacterium]
MDLNKLLKKMSLKEKLMQLTQLNAVFFKKDAGAEATGPMADLGLKPDDLTGIGSTLNFSGADTMKDIQKRHIAGDKNGVPMLFMMDVVHGYRTIYPIPLGIGASFEPDLMRECCAMAAKEAAAGGVQVTFGPMVDLVRDARWGRVMETTGEDPYLNCRFAKAQVEGFQGGLENGKIAACVKHYAAYGGAEAGRDYNTVDMSERQLREYYLPAYKAAVDAGVKMVMTSFNILDGVPASSNKKLVDGILRKEWGFDGVVISDYNAFGEMLTHGVAEDGKQAAYLAMNAGNDVEMMSVTYLKNMEKLVDEGRISMRQIDGAVMRLLKLKQELGMFENPYREADAERAAEIELCAAHRDTARRAAEQSAVLLKNDGVLPFSSDVKKVAVIGPFGNTGDIIGFWSCDGRAEDTVTVLDGVKKLLPDATVKYVKGVSGALDATDCSGVRAAARLAAASDAVILTLGEPQGDSGEGNSKLNLELPDIQYKLLDAVLKANKNTAVLLFSGRPLAVKRLADTAPAILEMWQPGTEGGSAAANLVFGKVVPSGKLPMTFPASTGQCPVYYNHYSTGRPRALSKDNVRVAYTSSYIDGPNRPLYPFGFGLSYASFEYSGLALSAEKLVSGGKIVASVKVRNSGRVAAAETVQLYVRDNVGSVVRPVKELKGFRKITLDAGEEKEVSFDITEDMLAFYNADLEKKAEKGAFTVFIGGDSDCSLSAGFTLE